MGMVHIYTGDGKGKTTAAVGLCTRAAGHGKKAAFYEFLKGAKTGEAKSLAALGVEFYCPVEREKFTWTMTEDGKSGMPRPPGGHACPCGGTHGGV